MAWTHRHVVWRAPSDNRPANRFRASAGFDQRAAAFCDVDIRRDLARLPVRLANRKIEHNPRSTRLIVDERGRPLGHAALRFRFDRAREAAGIARDEFQFRDLRAKAGTDRESKSDLREAQSRLGHTSVGTTEHYVRRRGKAVKPNVCRL
ncbi:tyrosine-type recombinase/integrase [Pandoraea communis]|uniref:tyrosine-type recombinase/integrase n=1 Tax=Pandoraea communis TaxID=2508297 RepID=UPI00123FC1DF|nr:tyrosine-type recombinase/integrase [Pandoraea communis]